MRSSISDDHARYLHRRIVEGCRNVSQLWRELVARGFDEKHSTVYQSFEKFRALTQEYADASRASVPLGRRLVRLLPSSLMRQSVMERDFVRKLSNAEPSLAADAHWTRVMNLFLRKKAKTIIDGLLDIGERTPLAKFSMNLRCGPQPHQEYACNTLNHQSDRRADQ